MEGKGEKALTPHVVTHRHICKTDLQGTLYTCTRKYTYKCIHVYVNVCAHVCVWGGGGGGGGMYVCCMLISWNLGYSSSASVAQLVEHLQEVVGLNL